MVHIPIDRFSGISTLLRDFWLDFNKAAPFYNGDFRDPAVWREQAARADATPRADRRQVVQMLAEQNHRFECGDATRKNIELLERPEALAIVTGQQVGLFTGPLYTIYKALTMCKLARVFSEKLQRPVVPVFYLVTEDHDFAEVQWAGVISAGNRFMRLVYSPQTAPQRTPMSKLILEPAIETVVAELEQNLPETEFKSALLETVRASYFAGSTMVDGFAKLFSRILRQYGAILLDASDLRLKEMSRPIFERELLDMSSVKAMAVANDRLAQTGYHQQLGLHPDRPHLFILDQGRHSLSKSDHGFRDMHSGVEYSVEQLLQQPARLSPKAALRPIVQDWLLPTLAYVGGPGELAYLAQLKEVYQAFSMPMPVIVPRAGFTLLEPKINRYLEKMSLTAVEALLDREAALKKVQGSRLPEEIAEYLNELRLFIKGKWPELGNRLVSLDPTLQSPLQKTESQIFSSLEQLEGKALRSIQQKETTLMEQWRAVSESLWPEGVLQERKLNVLLWLNKYGPALIERIYENIDPNQLDHLIMNL